MPSEANGGLLYDQPLTRRALLWARPRLATAAQAAGPAKVQANELAADEQAWRVRHDPGGVVPAGTSTRPRARSQR